MAQTCQNAVTRISPCGGSLVVSPGATNQKQTFTVYDLTAKGQSFQVSAACTGYVTSCSASPTTANINPNSSTPITVTYSVSNTGGTGQISLTGNSVTGYLNINSQHRPAIVTLPYYNNDNVQPTLCFASCFDKVLTYTTPAYVTLDTPHNVTLMYRSNTANPMVTVQVDALDSSTVRPSKMSLKVQRPNGTFVTFTNGTNELYFPFSTSIMPERLAGQFAPVAPDTLTNAYNYTAIVTSYWTDSTVLSGSTPLRVLLENDRSSVFGAGWTVAGQQTIHVQSNGDVMITDGMGAISYFKLNTPGCVQSCTFTSPSGDYTALTTKAVDQFGRHYDRRYPDGTTYEFLGGGALAGIYDKNGNQTVYWYDSEGRDSLISDPLGSSFSYGMHFAYGSGTDGWKAGAIRQIYDPYGRYTWFGVDANNDQRQIEDPMGGQYGGILLTIYAFYNTQHQLIANIDRHQAAWHFGYDFAGKLLADTTPAVLADGVTQGVVTKYQSSESTFLINPSTDSGSATLSAGFRGGGPWWASTTTPEGHQTNFTVDRWGQPLTLNDASGGTTTYARTGPFATVTTHPWGAIDTTTYTNGLLTYEHDYQRPAIHASYGNSFGVPDSVWGSHAPSRRVFVHANGAIDSIRVAGAYTTRFYYDARLRDTMIVDPIGHATHYAYDPTFGNEDSSVGPGNVVVKRAFDGYGRDVSETATGLPTSNTVYDALNRITEQYTTGLTDTTRFRYDSAYLVRVQDPKGQVYKQDVNALGWATRAYDPADTINRHTDYTYDKDGHRTSFTNRRGQLVSISYEALGRVSAISGAVAAVDSFSYSSNRRVLAAWNAVSRDTFYLSPRLWNDSVVTHIAGRRFTKVDTATVGDQIASVTWHSDLGLGNVPVRPTTFTWDSISGGLVSFGIESGIGVNIFYDGAHRRDSTWFANMELSRIEQYTTRNTVYHVAYPNFINSSDSTADTEFGRYYDYDAPGHIINAIQHRAGHLNYRAYGYDGLSELLQATNNATSAPGGFPAVDSSFGVGVSGGDSTVFWYPGYDIVGNDTLDSDAPNVYFHNSFAVGNRVQTHNLLNYTEDLDGNVTRRYDANRDIRFNWSGDGYLTSDSVAGTGETWQYDYNALGQLVRRRHNGNPDRYFLWDGAQLTAEMDSLAQYAIAGYYYYPGSNEPVEIEHHTGNSFDPAEYLIVDRSGSVIGALQNASGLTEVLTYDPWGVLNPALSNLYTQGQDNRLRWKGMMWEGDSTQLYYAGSRWYDPVLRRFMSEDPLGLSGGINEYTFGGNDPINATDPTGTCAYWMGGVLSNAPVFSVGHDLRGDNLICSGSSPSDPWVTYIQQVNVTAAAPISPSDPWMGVSATYTNNGFQVMAVPGLGNVHSVDHAWNFNKDCAIALGAFAAVAMSDAVIAAKLAKIFPLAWEAAKFGTASMLAKPLISGTAATARLSRVLGAASMEYTTLRDVEITSAGLDYLNGLQVAAGGSVLADFGDVLMHVTPFLDLKPAADDANASCQENQ